MRRRALEKGKLGHSYEMVNENVGLDFIWSVEKESNTNGERRRRNKKRLKKPEKNMILSLTKYLIKF